MTADHQSFLAGVHLTVCYLYCSSCSSPLPSPNMAAPLQFIALKNSPFPFHYFEENFKEVLTTIALVNPTIKVVSIFLSTSGSCKRLTMLFLHITVIYKIKPSSLFEGRLGFFFIHWLLPDIDLPSEDASASASASQSLSFLGLQLIRTLT